MAFRQRCKFFRWPDERYRLHLQRISVARSNTSIRLLIRVYTFNFGYKRLNTGSCIFFCSLCLFIHPRECLTSSRVILRSKRLLCYTKRSQRKSLERACLKFQRQKNIVIYYAEFRVGRRRFDSFVEECVMVELKALIQMDDSNLVQAFNYLEAYKMEVGLLINFSARSLQWKRVHKHYDPIWRDFCHFKEFRHYD